jgi:hypothetical protein
MGIELQDEPQGDHFPNSSGSFATFAAIRRASALLSSLALTLPLI